MARMKSRGLTSGRADDADEAIMKDRCKTFFEHFQPILDHYRKEGNTELRKEILFSLCAFFKKKRILPSVGRMIGHCASHMEIYHDVMAIPFFNLYPLETGFTSHLL